VIERERGTEKVTGKGERGRERMLHITRKGDRKREGERERESEPLKVSSLYIHYIANGCKVIVRKK